MVEKLVGRSRPCVELGIEPLRARWEAAPDRALGRMRDRFTALGSRRGDLDEWNDQLMHETAFGPGGAQFIKAGKHLYERGPAPPPELVSERRDAQRAVQIADE